ncbi:MAG: thioesterase family protein [Pseudomonadota bacterium]|nr:thioesterase family protein [Pseudomonadota bacterium]
MTNAKPYTGRLQQVEAAWTDYNGHLNMAYYLVMFDRAADELFTALGCGADYIKRTNCSVFVLETHTSYANELKAGEEVRIENRIIAFDQKRVHFVQQMFRADSQYLACVVEVMMAHVDLTTRRTSAFPTEILSRIEGMANDHAGLPLPPQVGHVIGLPATKR